MRMKEDHMKNGQLKPAYNIQISTNNQYIANYSIHQHTTDTNTLTTHLEQHQNDYHQLPANLTADAGYGSEENYTLLESGNVTAYVKYNTFDREQSELLQSKKPFTAVFASNDAMAIGCIHALRDRGIRVPEGVSVAGVDDIMLASIIEPTLTTVAQPKYEAGRQAVQMLTDRIQGEYEGGARQVQLGFQPEWHRLHEGGQARWRIAEVCLEQPVELEERLVVEDDVVEAVRRQARLPQAIVDRALREGMVVLDPREAFLLRGRDDFAVTHQRCRTIVVVSGDS